MSADCLRSPYQLGKRAFLDEEEPGRLPLSELKRARGQQTVSPARCGLPDPHQTASYSIGQSTLAALRALFPDMNDKVIADVLAEYGSNIDAAIKHLNDLRLSGGTQPGQHAGAAAAAPTAQQQQQSPAAPPPQQQQQQQAAAAQEPAGPEEPGAAGAPPAKSASEWVDLVVQQMAEASSVDDAKQRAANILQAFEQAAVQHAKQQGSAGDHERLKLQLQELAKENQLLKRAVAIQNTRMQELGSKEAEVQQLRAMLEGYQQKVHALEVQNYSLALHLKQATDSRDPLRSHKNPDVF